MKTFDVYQPWNIAFEKAEGTILTASNQQQYVDLYGGHGVISIGHNHPSWVKALSSRFQQISYYSNAVRIPEQEEVAALFQEISGLTNYRLFMCNSGAEANENALKVASFKTGRSKVLAFKGAFHGRTAGALAVTDNPKIHAPFGNVLVQEFFDLSDAEGVKQALESKEYAAVIVEGIQGVAGVFEPSIEVRSVLRSLCKQTETMLIADEIQSGCGRTGDFFAFQQWDIQPDLVTMAKGIGNGFPVAGMLVQPEIEPVVGQLGTTFGGSYLACAAVSAVLSEIRKNNWMVEATNKEQLLRKLLSAVSGIQEVKGRGLMLGLKLVVSAKTVQQQLLEKGFVTGISACPFTLRILPPLSITYEELTAFVKALEEVLQQFELEKQKVS
jgi:acetylornithine/N-succinyldiaminopimelate aminotransferase